ncbi:hypothetical protein G6M89_05570 [Natronolimnobius sp. AArcel1]|uniref:hypothetical protein n=1 Tax=Natronolimnobius sp. AArcel1 TaxID=1679093 RepID=UPI0013EAA4B4|nr:hypothetical protein [Natronolimnobius sp. AArcel1]NGM68483.1 hypothetical protein [Natronolimnobius sp. AArcel1]
MSDRTDEVTESRDARSTDDLLEETERLLEESGSGSESGAEPAPADANRNTGTGTETEAGADTATDIGSDSWLSDSEPATSDADATSEPSESSGGLRSKLPSLGLGSGRSRSVSPGEYFSPKGFLAAVLLLGVGMFAGGAVPFLSTIGQLIALFTVAFLVGLVTSKRRYLEMTTAGLLVGVLGAFNDYTMFILTGSGTTVFFVGAAIGLVSTVLGYYFGRDLRDGLARDIE